MIISLVVRWNDAIRVSMFVLVAICRVVKIYFLIQGGEFIMLDCWTTQDGLARRNECHYLSEFYLGFTMCGYHITC